MPQPVQTTAAQRQPQHLQYIDTANDHPLLHENHNHVINNYAGAAQGVPAQAPAAPPEPVCTDLTFLHTHL